MENIFDLSKNGAKKVYIDGELFPIRVGMREISLQNGEKVLVYDTSRPVYGGKSYDRYSKRYPEST